MRETSPEVVEAMTFGRGRFGHHEEFVEKALATGVPLRRPVVVERRTTPTGSSPCLRPAS